ncbi:MAG: hypothetical protein FJW95_01570 [Actinobacteria bacterium]|nr:hypothetical protein [Actinomycetota bacterium]
MSAPGPTGVEGFATVARRLAEATRAAGLAVPAFRSPPRVPGAVRTLRRYPGGTVVSVRLRDRPFDAVMTDMVEGVIVANRMGGEAALRARTYLAEAVSDLGIVPAPDAGGVASGQARVVERQTQAA